MVTSTPWRFALLLFLSSVSAYAAATPAPSNPDVQTGGRVFKQNNDLPSAIASEIAKATAAGEVFYTMSLAPGRADKVNEYHSLEVKVARPGLEARTRTGYCAQP